MRAKPRCMYLLWVLFAVTACLEAALSGQATSTQETTPILGVWRAQMDGLPFVTFTVTNEGGRLAGAASFSSFGAMKRERQVPRQQFLNRS